MSDGMKERCEVCLTLYASEEMKTISLYRTTW